MRIAVAAMLLAPVLLAGCASTATHRQLGSYESLQPRLKGGVSDPVAEIAAPASVAVVSIEPGGRLEILYPTHPDQPTRLEAGSHRLAISPPSDAGARPSRGAGPCERPGEQAVFPGEPVPMGATQTRRTRYRGKVYTCFRYASHRPGSTPPERQILMIATEQPWSFAEIVAQVEEYNRLHPSPASEPNVVAAAIAPGPWAAYSRPLPKRQ